jgi:hypothetical protein
MAKKEDAAREALIKQYEAIGAHMLSQEFVVSCLLETLAQSQPAIAEIVARKMKESMGKLPIDQYPGVRERLDKYLDLIRTQLAKKPQ